MMTLPLARVLRDFRMTTGRPSIPRAEGKADAPGMASPVSIGTGETLAARLAEAFAEGKEVGRAAAEAEHAQALADHRAHADAELALERQRWVAEEGEVLVAQLRAAAGEIEAGIAAQLANVLAPFLSENLRDSIVQDMSAIISDMLTTGSHMRICISGPGDLLARLRDLLGPDRPIEWEMNEGPEIRVRADETLIETDIRRWMARFEGAER